jgi:hypothetical protein
VSRPALKLGEKLSGERLGEPSANIRERVDAARETRMPVRAVPVSLLSGRL